MAKNSRAQKLWYDRVLASVRSPSLPLSAPGSSFGTRAHTRQFGADDVLHEYPADSRPRVRGGRAHVPVPSPALGSVPALRVSLTAPIRMRLARYLQNTSLLQGEELSRSYGAPDPFYKCHPDQ